MALCALNLASDIGNIWLRDQKGLRKRLFVGLFSTELSDSLRESILADFGEREQLTKAWLRHRESPSPESWREVLRHQKSLGFYFSFLEHIAELPREVFADPDAPGESIFFGDCLLRRHWSLDNIFNPIRRLMRIGLDDPEAGPYRLDEATGTIERSEDLIRDYRIVLSWLRHIFAELDTGAAPLRAVLAVPIRSSAVSRAIFAQLLREAGCDAVILRNQNELLNRSLGAGSDAPVILNISTHATELVYADEGGCFPIIKIFPEVGERFDREIEHCLQDSIRRLEGPESAPLHFGDLNTERLFVWKDAYRSGLWEELCKGRDEFSEFQFPYKVGEQPTFQDVRPLMTPLVLNEALARVFAEPLREAFEAVLSSRPAGSSPPRVLITGSGSRIEGIVDAVQRSYASVCQREVDSVTVQRVSEPLDAIVAGAMNDAESVSDEVWNRLQGAQKDWLSESIRANQLAAWVRSWRKLTATRADCAALEYEFPDCAR